MRPNYNNNIWKMNSRYEVAFKQELKKIFDIDDFFEIIPVNVETTKNTSKEILDADIIEINKCFGFDTLLVSKSRADLQAVPQASPLSTLQEIPQVPHQVTFQATSRINPQENEVIVFERSAKHLFNIRNVFLNEELYRRNPETKHFYSAFGLYTAIDGFCKYTLDRYKDKGIIDYFAELPNMCFNYDVRKTKFEKYLDEQKTQPVLTFIVELRRDESKHIFIEERDLFYLSFNMDKKNKFVQEKFKEVALNRKKSINPEKTKNEFDDMEIPLPNLDNPEIKSAVLCISDIHIKCEWDYSESIVKMQKINKVVKCLMLGREKYKYYKKKNSIYISVIHDIYDIFIKINLDEEIPTLKYEEIEEFELNGKYEMFHHIKLPYLKFEASHDLKEIIISDLTKNESQIKEKYKNNKKFVYKDMIDCFGRRLVCEQNVKIDMNNKGIEARAITVYGDVEIQCASACRPQEYIGHILNINKTFGISICKRNTFDELFGGIIGNDPSVYVENEDKYSNRMSLEETFMENVKSY